MRLYRGGFPKLSNAFFALDKKTAGLYGKDIHVYITKRKPKLFVINHNSLKKVFKYLSENTKLLLKIIFGTGLSGNTQNISYKFLFGKSPRSGNAQRLSVTDIDNLALAGFSKEYLLKHGYDGAYMPRKKTRFHKGVFHKEVYIARKGLLKKVGQEVSKVRLARKSVHPSISQLFVTYTKRTNFLLKSHRQFIHFLGGGMAVKLYLKGRGIKTPAQTTDFDFKFATHNQLRSVKQVNILSNKMKEILEVHVQRFVRFLNKIGIRSTYNVRELFGVPTDKPGVYSNVKKVYKVYTFSINGKDTVDTSLVYIPRLKREKDISRKWSHVYKMPIPTLSRLWKDTLQVLAGSFVLETAKLRNPINGNKKEKGIKNAIRAGHLSFLTSKRKKKSKLVNMSRRLIGHIIRRDKKASVIESKRILKQLKK